jgi:hypothetical protein
MQSDVCQTEPATTLYDFRDVLAMNIRPFSEMAARAMKYIGATPPFVKFWRPDRNTINYCIAPGQVAAEGYLGNPISDYSYSLPDLNAKDAERRRAKTGTPRPWN